MVINFQATVDKGLSHLKEGSAMGEVREKEINIAERSIEVASVINMLEASSQVAAGLFI